MEIVVVLADVLIVSERDVLAGKGGEVKDDFVPLAHADVDVVGGGRAGEEAGVRGNDLEVDLGGTAGLALEVEPERPGGGGVEEAQAVLAGFHVEVGPGLAVDVDNVAVERVGFAGGGNQLAVVLVFFGREDERNVVDTVSRGQAETVFGGIVNDVRAGLAKVGVLSGLGRELVE